MVEMAAITSENRWTSLNWQGIAGRWTMSIAFTKTETIITQNKKIVNMSNGKTWNNGVRFLMPVYMNPELSTGQAKQETTNWTSIHQGYIQGYALFSLEQINSCHCVAKHGDLQGLLCRVCWISVDCLVEYKSSFVLQSLLVSHYLFSQFLIGET